MELVFVCCGRVELALCAPVDVVVEAESKIVSSRYVEGGQAPCSHAGTCSLFRAALDAGARPVRTRLPDASRPFHASGSGAE